MTPRVVAVAQARMSSTRLPGKTLADLAGQPVIDHVVARLRRCARLDGFVVATTTHDSDDILAKHLEGIGCDHVRGSLDDVLSRYVLAARAARADVVVRITADCPLIDPEVIDAGVDAFLEAPSVDYCSNTLVRTYPIGMDTEVFTFEALARADERAAAQMEREHVTPYLYGHPDEFRLRSFEAPEWAVWPDLRLTVDEPSDLQMLRAVVEEVGVDASLGTVLDFLRAHPEVTRINQQVEHRHTEKPTSW